MCPYSASGCTSGSVRSPAPLRAGAAKECDMSSMETLELEVGAEKKEDETDMMENLDDWRHGNALGIENPIFYFKHRATGKCLDFTGGVLKMNPCYNNDKEQRFQLIQQDGSYHIKNVRHGKCIVQEGKSW